MSDVVKHTPADQKQVGGEHYKQQAIQHWTYVLANNIPYMEAQIIKYVTRWRSKGGIDDLRKAAHFLEKLIENEEAAEPGAGYVNQDR